MLRETDDNHTGRLEVKDVDIECGVHAVLPERELIVREESLNLAVQPAAKVRPNHVLMQHLGRLKGNIDEGVIGAQQGELNVKLLLRRDGLEIDASQVEVLRFGEIEGELVAHGKFVETRPGMGRVMVRFIALITVSPNSALKKMHQN